MSILHYYEYLQNSMYGHEEHHIKMQQATEITSYNIKWIINGESGQGTLI